MMVHAKNYETVSTLQKKNCGFFFLGHGVDIN